jgi:hypothetical protein
MFTEQQLKVLEAPLARERVKQRQGAGRQQLSYLEGDDVYRCPAGEILKYYDTNEEHGQQLCRYWTNACRTCALKSRCATGVQRRITRWEHEHVLEAVQRRLDANPTPCARGAQRSSIPSERSRRGWAPRTSC